MPTIRTLSFALHWPNLRFPCCTLGYPSRTNRITSTRATAQRSGAFCGFGVALWLCEWGDDAPDAVSVAKEWDGGGSDRHNRRDSTGAFRLEFPLVAARGCRLQATFLVTPRRARSGSGRSQRNSQHSRFECRSYGAAVLDECLWRTGQFDVWGAAHGDAFSTPRAFSRLVSGR